MQGLQKPLKALTIAVFAAVFISGCASAKKAPVAAAPAAAPAPAVVTAPAPATTPVQPAAPAEPKDDTYVVTKGDCLWCISGKNDIYGDPYDWPLLYKRNADQIKDADLIYPGQELKVQRGVSDAAIQQAQDHAKTRGAWTLGVTEESDKVFLAKSL
ncbi:MAG TPA: LysM peptidoglycan-binding domain-containing protein [Gammaproteobacteria bacterium]|nr:LysM peptidoglycan-binding domain-containing protein [Gammaproteobacteria bacterium]